MRSISPVCTSFSSQSRLNSAPISFWPITPLKQPLSRSPVTYILLKPKCTQLTGLLSAVWQHCDFVPLSTCPPPSFWDPEGPTPPCLSVSSAALSCTSQSEVLPGCSLRTCFLGDHWISWLYKANCKPLSLPALPRAPSWELFFISTRHSVHTGNHTTLWVNSSPLPFLFLESLSPQWVRCLAWQRTEQLL